MNKSVLTASSTDLTTSVDLVPPRGNREGLMIFNNTNVAVKINFAAKADNDPTAAVSSISLAAAGFYEWQNPDNCYTGAISVFAASAATGKVVVTEFYS
jgi:hypothetical protein